ncbi:MAG: response regulator transcription factor [Oscillospiraceae bacterium]|nr:response regulator transcription factor [Oscillospiraceae bacterium]
MIFCVEDDSNIQNLVVYALQSSGFEANGFGDGAAFFGALQNQKPQLIILDIMLPDEDGISLLRKLKSNSSTAEIPVIMLTAKTSEYDKVMGLDSGADDYITKPFGIMELVSRVKAVLRRSAPKEKAGSLQLGQIKLNTATHTVTVNETEITLTFKEFALLHYLMCNAGLVLSREKLLSTVWGYDYEGETRTVDVHINTLRQKLGVCSATIETVRGVGYRIAAHRE